MRERFEIIEHPADVGFLAYGATLAELFANAAAALMWLTCELSGVTETLEVNIAVAAEDLESLLFAWLAEILAAADGEQLVFCRASGVEISKGTVRGTLHGEPLNRTRHCTKTYIKAVTMHQLRIEETAAEGWRTQVFLDV